MSIKSILVATAIVALAALAAGCGDVCTRNSDCSNGLVCGPDATCMAPLTDAGVADADAVTDGGDIKRVDLDPTRDLDPPRDFDVPPDLNGPDLDPPRDLLPPRDLDKPADMTKPRDLAKPQDLSPPVDLLERLPANGGAAPTPGT